jgi:hypothetical protein
MDRQVAQRRPVRKARMIEFPGGAFSCMVRDLSGAGAALDMPSSIGIPEHFTLLTTERGGDGLGVEASGAKIGRLAWPSRRSHNINLISLPSGGEFLTLRDAANYITEFPKREHDAPAWRRHDACAALALPSTPEDNCKSPYKD